MEEHVVEYWRKLRLTPTVVARTRSDVKREMAEQRTGDKTLIATQTRRVQRLEAKRERLIDAYVDGALRKEDLKKRQAALDAEQREAAQLLSVAQINTRLVEERLEIALALLENCDRLYSDSDETGRRSLNQAFFAELHLDQHGVTTAILNPPFAQLLDRTIGLSDETEDDPGPGGKDRETAQTTSQSTATGRTITASTRGENRKNPAIFQPRGSNLTLMAEREGFEPSTHLSARTRFPVALLRPLGHLSGSRPLQHNGRKARFCLPGFAVTGRPFCREAAR